MKEDFKEYYNPGRLLLDALAALRNDIKQNYENGNVQQRALANIAGLQGDLFASYLILLWQGPIVGRSIILRSILENQANILHIKGNDKRSVSYLGFVEKMQQQVRDRLEGKKTLDENQKWTNSTISTRVSKIDNTAGKLYDTLSDFVHGNNIQDFINTEEITQTYIKSIDSCFVYLFINFMAELGVGLEMADKKRKLVFDNIDRAVKLNNKKNGL